MGHSYADTEDGVTDYTVTKSTPSGTIVRFTISTNTQLLTISKHIRQVLADAMDQFIAAERADLNTNGDQEIKGSEDYPGSGDGFKDVLFTFASYYCEMTLTALTGIAATGDITVSIPFGDA